MGEARRRNVRSLHELNGHVAQPIKRVRLVGNIKIQNADNQVMLLLGDEWPEMGAALTVAQARQLADVLLSHAKELDDAAPRIISPGE